jgi:hypothetical protein
MWCDIAQISFVLCGVFLCCVGIVNERCVSINCLGGWLSNLSLDVVVESSLC